MLAGARPGPEGALSGPAGHRARTATTWALLVLLAVAAVLACRAWVLEPVGIGSDSMEPTIDEGGLALVLKPGAEDRALTGSLVVFPDPTDGVEVVKRVVATEGQSVAIEDSVTVVDGRPADEPYVDHSRIDGTYFGPVTVPPGHVFVMGDNRAVSVDSRHYGSVALEDVEATVLLPRSR